MANIKFTQDNYTDYNAVDYFRDLGCKTVEFTFKYAPETSANPVPAILIHIGGSMPNGKRLNRDLWPQKDFTEEDFKMIFEEDFTPKIKPEDIGFRIGYAVVEEADIETGEIKQVVKVSAPRWLDFTWKGHIVELNGDRRKRYGE